LRALLHIVATVSTSAPNVVPDQPSSHRAIENLQPIVSGRYHDRFERRDGQWRFVQRHVRTDLLGDVSRHLRDSGDDAG